MRIFETIYIKKHLFVLLFTAHCSLFITHCFAQQPTQEWVRRYSHGTFADGMSVKIDSIGNVYVLIKMQDTLSTFLNDAGVVKYGSAGNFIWSVRCPKPANGSVQSWKFDVTSTGDVYVCTELSFSGQPFDQIAICKYLTNGILSWSKTYSGGNSGCALGDLKYNKSGSVIIGGTNYINNIAYPLLLRYNTNGDTVWIKTEMSFMHGNIDKIAFDDSDYICSAGYLTVGAVYNYLVLKHDFASNLQWFLTYDGPDHRGSSTDFIAVDSLYNIYVVGTNGVPSPGIENNTLLKISPYGSIVWQAIYKGIGENSQCATADGLVVTRDAQHIYYCTACNFNSNAEIVTLCYDANGDSTWVRRYRGTLSPGFSSPSDIKVDLLGNIYVAGILSNNLSGNDYVTIRYQSNGNLDWIMQYNGPLTNSDDEAISIAIDKNLNVYLTGTSSRQNSPTFLWDAATIRYSQTFGIVNNQHEFPVEFRIFDSYPNPFNPTTTIAYQLPRLAHVKIVITDVLGKVVRVVANEKKMAGIYYETLDFSQQSSGAYFCSMVADNKLISTKKMIVLK